MDLFDKRHDDLYVLVKSSEPAHDTDVAPLLGARSGLLMPPSVECLAEHWATAAENPA